MLDQGAVPVDVDLDELDAAAGGADHLLERGRELLAGAAPGGPEIDQDGDVAGGFDDILHEGLLIALDDHSGRHARGQARGHAGGVGPRGGAGLRLRFLADDEIHGEVPGGFVGAMAHR